MVLLTYQDDSDVRGTSVTAKESPGKSETPKTPYIGKLYAFNEVYAEEERCDLFFICQDGEIPAHRLVISNASKLIMTMQDDQPPWYPVYISVPDLTKDIVNTLVRLAYTGQMNIPPGYTSDELLDAMQALGWVNTDCLTATYLDSTSADEEFGSIVSSKTAESLETVLKMNFPVTPKGEVDNSDEEEDEMEMALPDVPMSDEDEGKLEIVTDTPKKKELAAKRGGRKEKAKKATPAKKIVPVATASKRRQSPKPTIEAKKVAETISTTTRKAQRSQQEDDVTTTPAKDNSTGSTTTENEPAEPLRSRTRTIKKPKKFDDDMIVMTPTKRKESPTKTPSKVAPKTPKQNETANDAKEIKGGRKRGAAAGKTPNNDMKAPGSKNQRTVSSESKGSGKITSYFNKRSPRKSNETGSADDSIENETADTNNLNSIQNSGEEARGGTTDNHTDIPDESEAPRKQRRSTSSKGDQEALPEVENGDADNSAKGRRKRNVQDNSELEIDEASNNPIKRGRKASTMSNASKSSNKASL